MVAGAAIGAIGSILSGILGAAATDAAEARNYRIDLLNYFARERERNDSTRRASQYDRDTKLGSTDAQGNRVRFVEGKGWVTDLSSEQDRMRELYNNEELAQLLNDLPKKRQVLNANVDRQGAEDVEATSLRDAFGRVQRPTNTSVENILNATAVNGLNEGFDSAMSDAMRASIRSGSSNTGKILSDIAAKKGNALRDAFMTNKANAQGMADQEYASKRADLANLYNLFATRASAMPDVSYQPRNIEGMTGQAQQGASGANASAVGALINAFAKQGGSMSKIEPNMGWANAVAGASGSIGAMLNEMADNSARGNAFDMYSEYAGIDPRMFKKNTGVF